MSDLKLDDFHWEEFQVSDLFHVFTGKNISTRKIISGTIPRITATAQNNGIALFTKVIDDDSFVSYDNFISVSFLGGVFYQKNSASLDMKIHGIKIKGRELNEYLAKFLIPLIHKFALKYSYGNQLSTSVLKRQKMILPINKAGEPNWKFMEDYIKQEQKIIARKIIDYYEKRLLNVENLLGIEKKKWSTFKFSQIFSVESVKGDKVGSYNSGNTPYVTTSSQNNGVKDFVESTINISKKKAISVDPIAGKAFYHDYNFVGRGKAGSAINLMYNSQLNKYNSKFICTMIEKVSQEKASYGVALNGDRLKNTSFYLPIGLDGKPDWEYMTKYIQNLEHEKIRTIIRYVYRYLQ